ncbi:hypothetical protein BRD03_01690 [Halobacteriales archaeon QS_9_68_17]|nr:MAG: hypothetical protein BRD03_01690 [Halobacteriales archaeon QS_9_68_17]
MRMARRVHVGSGVSGKVVKGFDRGDVAEALVGRVVFGIPILVEGGTLEVGAFIATRLGYYAATLSFGVALGSESSTSRRYRASGSTGRCSASSRDVSSASPSSRRWRR